MDLEPDICKIKEEIKQEELEDEDIMKVEQNYMNGSSSYCDEDTYIRVVKKEEPCDFETILINENVGDTTRIKAEVMEPEENMYIADLHGNILDSQELDVKEILDADISTMSCTGAESSVLRSKKIKRKTKNNGNTYKDTDSERESQRFKKTVSAKQSKTNSEVKNVTCLACSKSFGRKREFDEHILRHHNDDTHLDLVSQISSRLYQCNHCEYKTTKKYTLEVHLLKHTKDNILFHKCTICSYETVRKSTLIRHLKTHSSVKDHTCPDCSKSFGRKSELDEHILRHHNDNTYLNLVSKISSKVHECKHCDYKTTRRGYLSTHLLKHSKDNVKIHKCNMCNFETNRKDSLTAHFKTHSLLKDHICSECSRSFGRKREFDEHILRHHNNSTDSSLVSLITSKLHRCHHCGYTTTRKIQLSEHILSHSNDDTHSNMVSSDSSELEKCSYCELVTASKEDLSEHMLEHCKKSVPTHRCTSCGYETSRSWILKRHLKTHTKP